MEDRERGRVGGQEGSSVWMTEIVRLVMRKAYQGCTFSLNVVEFTMNE